MEPNDFETVILAQEGDEDALNIIYNKYKPLIAKKSKFIFLRMTNSGVDINDIMQEGFIGLNEAIHNFSQDNNVSFYTFACVCIDRHIFNFIRKNLNGNNNVLNFAISIDENLENLLSDDTNIENRVVFEDNKNNFIKNIKEDLTSFENKVFDLKLLGYSTEDIAEKLKKNKKSIYNTINRIKYKIRNYGKNDN